VTDGIFINHSLRLSQRDVSTKVHTHGLSLKELSDVLQVVSKTFTIHNKGDEIS